MLLTKKVALSLLLICPTLYAGTQPQPLQLTCDVESLIFLKHDLFNITPQLVVLADRATTPQGRNLLFNNENYEIWVKTHAYTEAKGDIQVTGYAITLLDKQLKKMHEATAVNIQTQQPTSLISHNLDEQFNRQGRLIVNCMRNPKQQ